MSSNSPSPSTTMPPPPTSTWSPRASASPRQFLLNAAINGEQAARSLDEIARNALVLRVFRRQHAGAHHRQPAAGPTVRWMTYAASNTRSSTACRRRSARPTLTVTVGNNAYTAGGRHAGCHQRLHHPERRFRRADLQRQPAGGRCDRRQFGAGGHRQRDRAAGRARQYRGSYRVRHAQMGNLLDAVAKLRLNAVPQIDGAYNCYLDPISARASCSAIRTSSSCSRAPPRPTRCSARA